MLKEWRFFLLAGASLLLALGMLGGMKYVLTGNVYQAFLLVCITVALGAAFILLSSKK